MNLTTSEKEAAGHMLGHYGYAGHPQGGSFTTKFIEALEVADPVNTAKMLAGFPEWRTPYSVMTTQGGQALADLLAAQK